MITLRLVGMTMGVSILTLWGVPRQDALRRAGATNPLASGDPQLFLVNVAAQVVDEMFLFGAIACGLALAGGVAAARVTTDNRPTDHRPPTTDDRRLAIAWCTAAAKGCPGLRNVSSTIYYF